jgi:hypothetical protein
MRYATCHPTEPVVAWDQCRRCYDRAYGIARRLLRSIGRDEAKAARQRAAFEPCHRHCIRCGAHFLARTEKAQHCTLVCFAADTAYRRGLVV